jgi:hypothetical protein
MYQTCYTYRPPHCRNLVIPSQPRSTFFKLIDSFPREPIFPRIQLAQRTHEVFDFGSSSIPSASHHLFVLCCVFVVEMVHSWSFCAAFLVACLGILSAPRLCHAQQSRIVGGATVNPLRYPYYVYFEKKMVKTTSNGAQQIQTSFCGASLM